jgi:O-antigen biosynthesis protein WbqV
VNFIHRPVGEQLGSAATPPPAPPARSGGEGGTGGLTLGGLSVWAVYLHDLVLAVAAMAATILVRYRFEPKGTPYDTVWKASLTFAVICAVVFPLFRLHRTLWRFTALNDVVRIAQAAAVSVLLLLPALFLLTRLNEFPRTALFVAVPVITAFLAFGRVVTQAWMHGDIRSAFRFENRDAPHAVVVGATAAVSAYLTALRRDRKAPLRIAGIIALDDVERGRMLQGAEVLGGLGDLGRVLKSFTDADLQAPQIVVAEPRPSRAMLEAVVAAAGEAGARVARIRPNDSSGGAVAPLEAADLLDRPPRRLDLSRARALIADKRVLVTGAGGTIGSELVRQALELEPAHLVLMDSSEFNLYAIDQALLEAGAAPIWNAALNDVRDPAGLKALFDREKPAVILHAAALKHVPLMEINPCEAVLTNIGGAINIARLARERCEALVFISTDKAVNPTNVMGATKRIAERCVHAIAQGGRARVAVVRFGNVLGSTGSVVPLFERQIAQGGPVTVTHPEMERYFMTVQEAASLVLQTGALPAACAGPDGCLYVLDMGEAVRIDHLARQLIRLHGLRPDVDIPIAYTGLRPGEKLYEEIFYDGEAVQATAADGVWAASDPASSWDALEGPVGELLDAARRRDDKAVLDLLQALEPAFRPAQIGA